MTRLLLLLVGTVLLSTTAIAGNLNILPMKPTEGGEITIEYKPSAGDKAWIDQAKSVTAVVIAFEGQADAPTAIDVPLKYDGKRYSGSITLPKSTVFGMVKVGDGVQYDNNKEAYWDFLVHNEAGRPLKDAHLRAALSWLGGLPPECRRKRDLDIALEEVTEENKNWPNNVTAQVNATLLMGNMQQISQEEGQARLREIIASNKQPKDPIEAIAIAQAHRMMNQQQEAAMVLQQAASRFPQSKVAEQLELEKLSTSASAGVFVERVTSHLRKYPNTFAKQNLVDYVVNSTTQSRDLDLLVKFLKDVDDHQAMTYYRAVNVLGAVDSLRPLALEMIDEGVKAADNPKARPKYVSKMEWNEQQRIAKSLLHFVKGAVLNADGKTDVAIKEYEKALKLGGKQSDPNTYAMYVDALQRTDQNEKAKEVSAMALSNGITNQTVLTAFRDVSAQDGMSEAEIEKEIQRLQGEGKQLLVQRLSREMLNMNMIDGTFTTRDGKPVNVSDWSGKVVILDYWATWCGPCRKSFPSLEKLYQKYKNHPNVQFAIVNVWERVDDRKQHVEDFLSKNADLTFPVFYDQEDAVVGKYGVTGIPTKFFLGKDGRIQFKEVGYLPEEQFLKEATEKIEVLLAQ